MKNTLAILIIAVALHFHSCSSGPEPLFTLPIEGNIVIPPGLNTFDTHYFYIRDLPTRTRTYLSGVVDEENVASITASRATLNARFVGIDWGLVREVSIRLISDADPTNSKEVFYQDRINLSGVNELQLFSSLSDVRDILLLDRVTVEVRINFRRITPVEIDSRLNMNFIVNGPE